MRLTDLKPVTQPLPVILPNGEDTGIVLQVISTDNAAFRNKQKDIMKASQSGVEPTVDELEKYNCEMLATCVTGWDGIEDDDFNPLPFTKEKCIEIFMTPEFSFIRQTVESFVSVRALFFRKGADKATGSSKAASKPRTKR